MKDSPSIVWFRTDLRIADNTALQAACKMEQPIIPVFILDEQSPGMWATGAAARWWLHHSLEALGKSLKSLGLTLHFLRGAADVVLPDFARSVGAGTIYWNRRYEPWAIQRDTKIKQMLRNDGYLVKSFNSSLLFEPAAIHTRSGQPFKVFTPFWHACLSMPEVYAPFMPPEFLRGMTCDGSEQLESWHLLPTTPDWSGGLKAFWQPGEMGAKQRLDAFLADGINQYADVRNRPDLASTSRLSPHLRWGEISPRKIWNVARRSPRTDAFLRQLVWREFSYHLLLNSPTLPITPLDTRFEKFPWDENPSALKAWQRGCTGYPIVDAGMRELWQTGWMHNRVRMVCASFLVKDLFLPWQDGEKWFWDTLVDADLANNAAGWQWVAGCGADAAPYYRIFNPVLQGKRFDPDGKYVRQFVPELAKLPAKWIHQPWDAPPEILDTAEVKLGKSYPLPIVHHQAARERALSGLDRINSLHRNELRIKWNDL